MEKKNTALKIRISDSLHYELLQISPDYATTPSGLGRLLLERFAAAHKKHGSQLAYPPQFAYHAAEAKPEIELQQKPMVAADSRSTYAKGKKGKENCIIIPFPIPKFR